MSIDSSLENTVKVGSYVDRAGLAAAGALVWLAFGLGAVVSASGAPGVNGRLILGAFHSVRSQRIRWALQ